MPIRPPAALLPSFYAQPTLIRTPVRTGADDPTLLMTDGSLAMSRDALQEMEDLAGDDRYTFTGHIGSGSSSEVYRVRDLRLERFLALKVLRPECARDNNVRERFLAEAQAMARLQHPGILPVYDVGELEDGRPFFTMQEVSGENLGQLLHRRQQVPEFADQWPISRLLTVFRQACSIVAFAHGRNVLHLDIKPENLLVGEQDAMYVVDWGLTQEVGVPRLELLGTPAYMAPEQLLARDKPADARTDVYALGAVLYQLLAGSPPYAGSPEQVLRQVEHGPPMSLLSVAPQAPAPLVRLVERAMARKSTARFPSAKELGQAVDAWLDGTQTRQRVHRLIELAESRVDDARLLQGQATQLRFRVARLQTQTATWSPEEHKHRLWDLEDRAELLEREARFKLLERRQILHAASTQAPDMPQPRALLAACFREDHDEAEARGDEATRRMAEERLREHLAALPEDHDIRREYLTWLKGTGALTIATSKPDAEILLERYANFRRRLRVVPVRALGEGSVEDLALPMGSYRLRIRAPGCAEVLQPVRIARGHHWRAQRGPHGPSVPTYLPPAAAVGPDDRYVPAGRALISNGEGEMVPVWVGGFVLRTQPVTNRDYLAFLNDLVGSGQAREASRLAPRLNGRSSHGAVTWQRDDDGQFLLPPASLEQQWRPNAPVVGVSWHAAMAYARWESQRTGQKWRLPHEVEWEKAARGVDGRRFPWGSGPDPARACIWSSRAEPDGPVAVDTFTTDESPFGCRHLAGNVHEWCSNVYTRQVPLRDGQLAWPEVGDTELRTARGASWRSRGLHDALSQRQGLDPEKTEDRVGFRLARTLGPNR